MGVVRLVLPEKLARSLVEEELPLLDRPVRFAVSRGRRGRVSADTLLELQEQLDMPWTPDELEALRDGPRGERPGRGTRPRGATPGKDRARAGPGRPPPRRKARYRPR